MKWLPKLLCIKIFIPTDSPWSWLPKITRQLAWHHPNDWMIAPSQTHIRWNWLSVLIQWHR